MGRPEDFIYRCNMLGLAIITGVCVKRMFTLRDFLISYRWVVDDRCIHRHHIQICTRVYAHTYTYTYKYRGVVCIPV